MGRLRRCVGRCGGNGWSECGEAIGIFGWGEESGSKEPEAAPGFENGAWPSPGLRRRAGMVRTEAGDVGTGAPATVHRLGR